MWKSEFTGTIFLIIPATLSAPYRSALQAVARLARPATSVSAMSITSRVCIVQPLTTETKNVSEILHTNATDTELFHQVDFTEYHHLSITHTYTHNSVLIRTQVKQQVGSQQCPSLCTANTDLFQYKQHI